MPACMEMEIAGLRLPVYTAGTLIVGSGAAALNCAEHLYDLAHRDLIIATDKLGAGTSNNSGSDKQTYYKIGVFGDVPDSPMDFARSLTAGGMMHGDLAYVEGVGSATEFFHLIKNGVPFPFNRYGAYVGYKTDHDPRQRATSCGPKTSMHMYRCSLEQVRRNRTKILDRHEVIRLLVVGEGEERRVIGAVALDRRKLDSPTRGLVLFSVQNVVMATGGPGEMYRISVYPRGQIGNHGIALEIGAVANNLTESQYGLASTKFRWNLSGTYQQVIPCYFSTSARGGDRRFFLNEYFNDMRTQATDIFLKGYQWPFHAERLQNMGSSVVDIAVHNEIAAGRRVFMDFTRNPVSDGQIGEFSLEDLGPEARRYLERSGAFQATPYERLAHMNPASIDIYTEHNIDLHEPLEVAVCAQHNNGGLRGDLWWESNIRCLFSIGELNGCHGVRPGGSALNSGQVGGLRAAQRIAAVYNEAPRSAESFAQAAVGQVSDELSRLRRYERAAATAKPVRQVRAEIQDRMSREGAFIRNLDGARRALSEARALWRQLQTEGSAVKSASELPAAIQNEHLCLTHIAFLQTIVTYIEQGGGSRGAYVVLDERGDRKLVTRRGEEMPHRAENLEKRKEIFETTLSGDGEFAVRPVPVRPLPQDDSWYETTWRDWQEGRIYL